MKWGPSDIDYDVAEHALAGRWNGKLPPAVCKPALRRRTAEGDAGPGHRPGAEADAAGRAHKQPGPRNQYESMELIRHCAHGHHIAVLVVIHDLNLALRFCDRFLFLKDGTVYASGGREAVTSENIRAVYGMDARCGAV